MEPSCSPSSINRSPIAFSLLSRQTRILNGFLRLKETNKGVWLIKGVAYSDSDIEGSSLEREGGRRERGRGGNRKGGGRRKEKGRWKIGGMEGRERKGERGGRGERGTQVPLISGCLRLLLWYYSPSLHVERDIIEGCVQCDVTRY